MIPLDQVIKGMAETQRALRTSAAIVSPTIMSEQMMRLSQYAGALDEHLAELEKEYEIVVTARIQKYMKEGIKTSPAETKAKTELGEQKGQILYLTRLSSSAWRQVGTIQSRVNHLKTESQTNI